MLTHLSANRSPRLRGVVALTLAAALLAGCVSTHYVPRHPGYLAVVQHDGMPMYSRGGQLWQADFFGEGLIRATADVPVANRYARDARDGAFGFLGLYLGGLASMLGAVPFTVNGALADDGFNGSTAAGVSLFGLGLVLLGMSVWSATSMNARRFDAINAYNDLHFRGAPATGRSPTGFTGPPAPRALPPSGHQSPGSVD